MGSFDKIKKHFLASKTLKDRSCGFFDFFKAAIKIKHESPTGIQMGSVPLMELLILAEDIHVKTKKASQNTDSNIQKVSVIDTALQFI